jgi:RecB family exonuclease
VKVPSTYLRELHDNKALKSVSRARDPLRLLFDMEANAPSVVEKAAWLKLPAPNNDRLSRLSVHAVETYAACPLRFKLQREWNLPAQPAAAMQFGAVMHRVIHEHFRAISAGRTYSESDLVGIFRSELKESRLADPIQHDLYEQQGIDQLRRFLRRSDLPPAGAVVGTEQRFSVKIKDVEVIGRIDRIDRVDGGRLQDRKSAQRR